MAVQLKRTDEKLENQVKRYTYQADWYTREAKDYMQAANSGKLQAKILKASYNVRKDSYMSGNESHGIAHRLKFSYDNNPNSLARTFVNWAANEQTGQQLRLNGGIAAEAAAEKASLKNIAASAVHKAVFPIASNKDVQKVVGTIGKGALKLENGVHKVRTVTKKVTKPFDEVVTKPASMLLRGKISTEMYRAGQDNAAMEGVVKIGGFALNTVRDIHNFNLNNKSLEHKEKLKKLQRKQHKLLKKADKSYMNAVVSDLQANHLKTHGAEAPKATRKERKAAWRKVYMNYSPKTDGKEIIMLSKPEKPPDLQFKQKAKSFFTNDREYFKSAEHKKASKKYKLEKKAYRNEKKTLQKVTVKSEYFNELTGETTTVREKQYVKKSRAEAKLKPWEKGRLNTLVGASVTRLGGTALRKAFESDDNEAVKAAGKGVQFLYNEFTSKTPALKLAKRQKKADKKNKKVDKAAGKAEKYKSMLQFEEAKEKNAASKLKFERDKPEPKLKFNHESSEKVLKFERDRNANAAKKKSGDKKAAQKKAQKKSAQKKRNSVIFKNERTRVASKRLTMEAAKKTQIVMRSVGSKVGAGVVGVGLAMLLPIIFISLLFMGLSGDVAGASAAYLNDREGLIDYNNAMNELMWKWQSAINSQMNAYAAENTAEWQLVLNACSGGPVSNCPNIEGSEYVEDPNNVYNVKKVLYGGEKCGLSNYDITSLYAYFTVKYKEEGFGNWGSIESELGDFFDTYFVLHSNNDNDVVIDKEEEYVLDNHIDISCEIKGVTVTLPDGTEKTVPGPHDHTVEVEEHTQQTSDKKRYYYLYPKDEENPMTIQGYIKQELKKIGEKNEDGISEGEEHYALIMKSLGAHQVIDNPIIDAKTGTPIDWSYGSGGMFGTVGELYNVNEDSDETGVMPDYRYRQKNVNDITVSGSDKLECVAGGSGIITAKTSDSITVEYTSDNLKITYSCGSLLSEMTALSVGSPVISGTHLFCCNEIISAMHYTPPTLGIKAYDTELNSLINPYIVIMSKVYEEEDTEITE
ncbi:MAG: hypothetical protein NC452_10020 [Eubacterium sp.]|nr:hypothetical protein [Eubacterium sp.]